VPNHTRRGRRRVCPGAGTTPVKLPLLLFLVSAVALAQADKGPHDAFLENVLAIAQHGNFGDFEFIGDALGVKIEPKPGGSQTVYRLDGPPGSPATSILYGYVPGPPGTGGLVQIVVDPAHGCITIAQVRRLFGAPQNDWIDGYDRVLAHEVWSKGPNTTGVLVTYAQKPAVCARRFQLRVGYKQRPGK
jgi:hypothetical protein